MQYCFLKEMVLITKTFMLWSTKNSHELLDLDTSVSFQIIIWEGGLSILSHSIQKGGFMGDFIRRRLSETSSQNPLMVSWETDVLRTHVSSWNLIRLETWTSGSKWRQP